MFTASDAPADPGQILAQRVLRKPTYDTFNYVWITILDSGDTLRVIESWQPAHSYAYWKVWSRGQDLAETIESANARIASARDLAYDAIPDPDLPGGAILLSDLASDREPSDRGEVGSPQSLIDTFFI